MSRSRLAKVEGRPLGDLQIMSIDEFSRRLKVPTRTGYRIAAELPPGCVLRVRHGRRVIWERAVEALSGGDHS